jgi:hypothetical protein|nr:hypothetical protein [Kofleriaceae bacterium]
MRVFVMGASHAGKTPAARRIAAALGVPCIGASAWVRARFPALPAGASDAERAAQVTAMTAWAIDELRTDPDRSAAALRATAPARCVIEGVRNPYDFIATFDARCDVAVFLRHTGAAAQPTAFETGVDVIRDYVAWAARAGLVEPGRVLDHAFARFGDLGRDEPDTLEHAIVELERVVTSLGLESLSAQVVAQRRVHAQLPAFAAQVRAEYLYGMDPSRVGQLVACTVFSVSSYLGSAPTFQLLLGDGAVFSYVPPWALVVGALDAGAADELGPTDLVYHDCKSTLIAVHELAALRGPALAYFKRIDRWVAGDYRFTIDWYAGNEMMHAIALATGQLALLPSHKVKFGDHPAGFQPYKKIRREWSVE